MNGKDEGSMPLLPTCPVGSLFLWIYDLGFRV